MSASLPPLPDSILFSNKRPIHPSGETDQNQSTDIKKQRVPEENITLAENTAITAMSSPPFSVEAPFGEDIEILFSQIQANVEISALQATITNQQEQINALQKMVETFNAQQPKSNKTQLVDSEGKCYYRGSVDSNNKPHGKGTWYNCYGTIKGTWKNGKQHGYTVYNNDNGDIFSTTFVDGIQKGFSIFKKFQTQEKYKGNFENGKQHGKVSLKLPNGDKFEGMWKNGLKNGKGIWRDLEGKKFEGTWKDDICIGNGVMSYANGNKYTGEIKPNINWREITRHGRGELISSNGCVWKGNWENGRLQGQGISKDLNGYTYEGNFENGHKSCAGTETDKFGNVNIGFWKNSRFTVLKRNCSNGSVEEGKFNDNWKLNGRGKMTEATGKVKEGLWWDGRLIDFDREWLFQQEAVVICDDIYNRYRKQNGPNEVNVDFFNVHTKEKYQILREKIRAALHPDNNINFSSAQKFFKEFCDMDSKKIHLIGVD